MVPTLRVPRNGRGDLAPLPFALEFAMFGSIGMPELVIILVIALIIFGPRKLPELGKSLGKSINEFKKGRLEGTDDLKDDESDGKA